MARTSPRRLPDSHWGRPSPRRGSRASVERRRARGSAGAVLRVRETFVRGAEDTPKSEAGERTIALGPKLAEELWQHRRRTSFAGDDERVFCHPTKGSPLDHKRFARTLRRRLGRRVSRRRCGPSTTDGTLRLRTPLRPGYRLRHSWLGPVTRTSRRPRATSTWPARLSGPRPSSSSSVCLARMLCQLKG
jgi:hypothetical protein